MNGYEITKAIGRFIVIEPVEKSTVLKADQISTIFRVISAGTDIKNEWLEPGTLIILEPSCVNTTKMADKDVYYVRETDIVAVVTEVDYPKKEEG